MEKQEQEQTKVLTGRNINECPHCQNGWITRYQIHPEYSKVPTFDCKKCTFCGGTGRGAEQDGRSIMAMAKKSGIPSVFSGKLLHDIDWGIWGQQDGNIPEMKETIEDFIENFDSWVKYGKGLYLFSRCKGSGKSFFSAVIANELIRQGVNVRFVRSADLLNLATDSSKANRGEVTAIEKIKSVKLLILDDIGEKRAGKDYFADVLFDLMDYRLTAGLPTIFTSNYRLGDLPFDEWLVSRINSACVSVSFPEVSIRTAQAKKELADFKKAIHERQSRKKGA